MLCSKIKLEVKDHVGEWVSLYNGPVFDYGEIKKAVKDLEEHYYGHAVRVTYYEGKV